jgi:hypothetical protein
MSDNSSIEWTDASWNPISGRTWDEYPQTAAAAVA